MNISIEKIKEALPKRAEVTLTKYNGSQEGVGTHCIKTFINNPPLEDDEFEMCKKWQREIIGDQFMEFYTEESGRLWYAFLKFNNKPITYEIG